MLAKLYVFVIIGRTITIQMGQRQNREPERTTHVHSLETDKGALWRRHVDQNTALQHPLNQ